MLPPPIKPSTKFRFFLELKDVDRLKGESWPSMSPKAYCQLKNTFAVLSQITLQEDCAGTLLSLSTQQTGRAVKSLVTR